jgi:hypothetical protein
MSTVSIAPEVRMTMREDVTAGNGRGDDGYPTYMIQTLTL